MSPLTQQRTRMPYLSMDRPHLCHTWAGSGSGTPWAWRQTGKGGRRHSSTVVWEGLELSTSTQRQSRLEPACHTCPLGIPLSRLSLTAWEEKRPCFNSGANIGLATAGLPPSISKRLPPPACFPAEKTKASLKRACGDLSSHECVSLCFAEKAPLSISSLCTCPFCFWACPAPV